MFALEEFDNHPNWLVEYLEVPKNLHKFFRKAYSINACIGGVGGANWPADPYGESKSILAIG